MAHAQRVDVRLERAEEDEREAHAARAKPATFVREERKVGRNEPCPCGSGRKYKQCHGRIEQ